MNKIDQAYMPVIDLAKEVGAYQKKFFRNPNLDVTTKSTSVDMVTEVDLYCDNLIVDTLRRWYPEDHILSEEQGVNKGTNGYTWIIDPLDGTTNYSIGHPIFAVSIARWKGDTPVFGVVYVPMLEEIFVAEKGKGAYLNGQRLTGSKGNILSQAVLGTGFPYDRATAANNNSENIALMIPKVKGIRRLGAAAYDLCLVAAGVLDAYWELRLGKWDLAAGMLMVQEAGGKFYFVESHGKFNVICGDPDLCNEISDLVDLENHDEG